LLPNRAGVLLRPSVRNVPLCLCCHVQAKLKLPLLAYQKDAAHLLTVNFDPALVKLLREVKYFLLLGLEVPGSALEIFQKAETFRRQTGNLDLLVNMCV
jgi:dynein heavy chain